jgi:predicted amidophosphoribosyltransferase
MEKKKVRTVSVTRMVTIEEKLCPVCKKKFDAMKQRRYCGLPCRMKANYARHAEQYRTARREKYQAEKQTVTGKK